MHEEVHRAHADLDLDHWWFRGRRRIIAATLARWVRNESGVVADLGCGTGGMLGTLAPYGTRLAIESNATSVDLAASRNPDVEVRIGELPDAIFELPPCSLVTAFDVLEHIRDDGATLRAIRLALQDDGLLCLTVPALPWLWSNHDDVNGHVRRYTARSLRDALEGNGFSVVHLSYFNSLLLPAVALARLLGRVRGEHSSAGDFSRSFGPFGRVLESVFSFERHIVPRSRLPVGVSLIAVAARTNSPVTGTNDTR